MAKINDLSDRIIRCATSDLLTSEEKQKQITDQIRWFVDDVLMIKKNIDQTSLSGSDHLERCISVEREFGINKIYLTK